MVLKEYLKMSMGASKVEKIGIMHLQDEIKNGKTNSNEPVRKSATPTCN